MIEPTWITAKKYEDITYRNQMVLLELHLTDPMLEMHLDQKPPVNYMMHFMMRVKTPL